MAGKTKRTKRHKKIEQRIAARKKAEKIKKVLEEADSKLSKLYKRERTTPFEIGKLFNTVKSEVGHGYWMKWLKDKQYTSESTAKYYMAIAETFPSAKESGLFSIGQQAKLSNKKLRKEHPEIIETMIERAEDGERWTNQKFKEELNKLQSTPREQASTKEAVAGDDSFPAGKPDQERWVDHVEGLISSVEAAKGDYDWDVDEESEQIRARMSSIRRRLRSLGGFFKSPTVGDLANRKRIYVKKHYKGRRHA